MKRTETVITTVEFEVGDVVMFSEDIGFYRLGDIILLRQGSEPGKFKAEGAGSINNISQKWLCDLLEESQIELLGELK